MPAQSSLKQEHWKQLYLAALFEKDKASAPAKLSEAYDAILARRQQLFTADNSDLKERQALDNALFALKTLTTCLGSRRSIAA